MWEYDIDNNIERWFLHPELYVKSLRLDTHRVQPQYPDIEYYGWDGKNIFRRASGDYHWVGKVEEGE